MQRVLMVTDNPRPLAPLREALVRAGFAAVAAGAAEAELDRALAGYPPDLCVVDSAHCPLSPARVRQHLGTLFGLTTLPVLLLLPDDRLGDLGQPPAAEDFMMQPYRPGELVVRVQVLLWRTHRADPSHVVTLGDLVIDQNTYQVWVAGRRLELTYKEYELLRFLATHRGKVFTRETLLAHVWGFDYYGGVRTVDVHVRRVRAKLSAPADALLETVRNVGYRFSDTVPAASPREEPAEREA